MLPRLGRSGEFEKIRELADRLGESAGPLWDDTGQVPKGVGTLVTSTDSSIEGVHFRRHWLSLEEIGWRSAAAAFSDIAAAAARPVGCLAALSVPKGSPTDTVLRLMTGVADATRSVGARVLGGDLSNGPGLALTITVMGYAEVPGSRQGAAPGDSLWITGDLGGARAALKAWEAGREPSAGARSAFAHPRARVAAAIWLQGRGAKAFIDLSDGLAGDCQHLAAASGVRLELNLDALPIHPSAHREAVTAGEAAPSFAAIGGEDYELLVAMPAEFDDAFGLEAETGVALRRIGVVQAGSGVSLLFKGTPSDLDSFEHAI